MKKILYAFTAAAFALGMCDCDSKQPADANHSSENSLDWAGVYTGVIPSASGPGIDVTITLRDDLTYELRYRYIDRPGSDFTTLGTFKWNKDGGVITLDNTSAPPHYRVGENKLIQLDMEGNPITGALADNYVLKKELIAKPSEISQTSGAAAEK